MEQIHRSPMTLGNTHDKPFLRQTHVDLANEKDYIGHGVVLWLLRVNTRGLFFLLLLGTKNVLGGSSHES